jgi:hypothetical protein
MRIAVLILALLGAVTAGFLGYKWFSDSRSPEVKAARDLAEALGQLPGAEDAKAKVAEHDRLVLASYFLMGAFVLGIAGGALAYTGKGVIAGIILLVAAGVPAVLAPKSLVFSCPLVVAGVLSFLIRPAPPVRTAI